MTESEIRTQFSKADSRHELLSLLNGIKKDMLGEKAFPFTLAQLNYFCNSSHTANHYRVFEIPKKSGGSRQICAPMAMLKSMLSCVNILLQAIYTPSESATGFIHGRSVMDNANKHTGKLYVFNSDLKDFFPSISKYRVRAALMAKPICATRGMADAIANMCCAKMAFRDSKLMSLRNWQGIDFFDSEQPTDITYKDFLPQGSPASPAMTNIICRHLDWQMEHLARKHGCVYSRYADDMTFSCNRSIFSPGGDFYGEFTAIVCENGFKLNREKTRVQKKGCRQEVTGLVVSDKVNVPKGFIRDIENALHIWSRYGYRDAATKYAMLHPHQPFCGKEGVSINLENIIGGKLNYIRMVKGENDQVYVRLSEKFKSVTGKRNFLTSGPYVYTAVFKMPEFEKIMNCKVKFNMEKVTIRKGVERDMFSGSMEIYGNRTKACLGSGSFCRLMKINGFISTEKLMSMKDKFFISRCYNTLSRNEFWLITDRKPFYDPNYIRHSYSAADDEYFGSEEEQVASIGRILDF